MNKISAKKNIAEPLQDRLALHSYLHKSKEAKTRHGAASLDCVFAVCCCTDGMKPCRLGSATNPDVNLP